MVDFKISAVYSLCNMILCNMAIFLPVRRQIFLEKVKIDAYKIYIEEESKALPSDQFCSRETDLTHFQWQMTLQINTFIFHWACICKVDQNCHLL